MSRSHQAPRFICARSENVPLLRLLAAYMDSNKCIEELLKLLEEEKCNVRREKLAVARLQREVARSRREATMREKLMCDLEEERRLRVETEKHLRQVREEAELGRLQMVSLQEHFSRMEETVRSLLQNQGALDPNTTSTVNMVKAFKDKLSEEMLEKKESLMEKVAAAQGPGPPIEGSEEEDGGDATRLLMERLRALEVENSALAMENENQREQYERCLDEVANQVVQALLTQKDLREECLKLRTRVFDLEQQNRTLSALFQQRIWPASDLLQKLQSRIMGLSTGDLLLEPERSRSFLLPRGGDSPVHEHYPSRRKGLPVVKCQSQMSLTVPAHSNPRSSCSSSELSISSACSEFSSGSYTWNDGRSFAKLSSLTWEKRSLGLSAPGNICGSPEDKLSTWKKECDILEGLKRLQKHRPKEAVSLASKSNYKDCMNSNEGIYSLGMKSVVQEPPKQSTARLGEKGQIFSYDSEDADDEPPQPPGQSHCVVTKAQWVDSQRLSHNMSESICGLSEGQYLEGTNQELSCPKVELAKCPLASGSGQDQIEPLLTFSHNPSLPLSTTDEKENSLSESVCQHKAERLKKDSNYLTREDKLFPSQRGKADPSQSQPATSMPETVSHLQTHGSNSSGGCNMGLFEAVNGEPIKLRSQQIVAVNDSEVHDGIKEPLSPFECAWGQIGFHKGDNSGQENYTVLESPEKLCETAHIDRPDVYPELLQKHVPQQKKLIKPPYSRTHSSRPPMHCATSTTIPSSPKKFVKDSLEISSVEQEKAPSSPPVKLSRFIKPPGGTFIPLSSRLPPRNELCIGPSNTLPGSPLSTKRHLEHVDYGEPPTHDQHCDSTEKDLRSPSPPPPPGRSTSLLVRPRYDQALKPGAKNPNLPTLSTVKGPSPGSIKTPQHQLSSHNMQLLGSQKSYSAAKGGDSLTPETKPHKLEDNCSQPQSTPKSSTLCQMLTKVSPKHIPTKLLNPSPSGRTSEFLESTPKSSKTINAPHTSQKNLSLQCRKGLAFENRHPLLCRASTSLPISLEGHSSNEEMKRQLEMPNKQTVMSSSGVVTQNSDERVAKSRIPFGKPLGKMPSTPKKASTVPGKPEKEHVNTAAASSKALTFGDKPQSFQRTEVALWKPKADIRCSLDVETLSQGMTETDLVCKPTNYEQRLFKRSVSVSTKPHLKPALGMNGAKARSQSFSTNYMEKPSLITSDGQGKVRTQIRTSTGDRGNSLTRQVTILNNCQVTAAKLCGESNNGFHRDLVQCSTQKSLHSSPFSERVDQNFTISGRVSQFKAENPVSAVFLPNQSIQSKVGPKWTSATKDQDDQKNPVSPSSCTIEEKVMMGIEQNVQKVQCQLNSQASEPKQKTGSSLASWFGFRRSKLPAVNGKKTDELKEKGERKELKIASVLGGKQMKSEKKKDDKKKERRKNDTQGRNGQEQNDKSEPPVEEIDQHLSQIQSSGKEDFRPQYNLHRNLKASKSDGPDASLCGIPIILQGAQQKSQGKGSKGMHTGVTNSAEKVKLKSEDGKDAVAESNCQHLMIGSTCQMRTLDSGFGTFPLPDSARHLAQARCEPVVAETSPAEPTEDVALTPVPESKVPSRPHTCLYTHSSLSHSASAPVMRASQRVLPRPASLGIMNHKRLSPGERQPSPAHNQAAPKKPCEKRRFSPDMPLVSDRSLTVCMYSRSSSEDEDWQNKAKHNRKAEQDKEEMKVNHLPITEFYKQDVLAHYGEGRDDSRLQGHTRDGCNCRISEQLGDTAVGESKPRFTHASLERLNKLNSRSRARSGTAGSGHAGFIQQAGEDGQTGGRTDNLGSLSDSLYDSFSSCASQGSNDV